MDIPRGRLARFCKRWHIAQVALFGSVLRDDFGPDSDVDVLVTFAPEAAWSFLDHLRMESELAALLDRDVDLFTRRAVERSQNPIRRQEILSTAEVIYGA
jgi:predicted nucleotidyltransferase